MIFVYITASIQLFIQLTAGNKLLLVVVLFLSPLLSAPRESCRCSVATRETSAPTLSSSPLLQFTILFDILKACRQRC